MSVERVEWAGDVSTCGRFSVNSEHVRGEPRWYFLQVHDAELAALYRRSDFDGAYDKRAVKRAAQRLVELAAAT